MGTSWRRSLSVTSALFVGRSKPSTAKFGEAKIHKLPLNMFVLARRLAFFLCHKHEENVCTLLCFSFSESTVTSGVYLDIVHGYLMFIVIQLLGTYNWTTMTMTDTYTSGKMENLLITWKTKSYINTHFPVRRIGRRTPVAWPPHSPDFTALDVVLWGFAEDRIYRTHNY